MSRRRKSPPVLLVLLEGMGVAPAGPSNGVSQAQFPYLGSLGLVYPQVVLEAAGPAVGLAPDEPAGLLGGLRALLEGGRTTGGLPQTPALVSSFAEAGLRQRLVFDHAEPGLGALLGAFGGAMASDFQAVPVSVAPRSPSAIALTQETVRSLRAQEADVYYVLLRDVEAAAANGGSVTAAARACEVVDDAVSRMAPEFLARGGLVAVVGTHGRAEDALCYGSPLGSGNPVWFFLAHPDARPSRLASPSLLDVAPTLLEFAQVPSDRALAGRPVVVRASRG